MGPDGLAAVMIRFPLLLLLLTLAFPRTTESIGLAVGEESVPLTGEDFIRFWLQNTRVIGQAPSWNRGHPNEDVADSDAGYEVSEGERQAAREEWWLAVKKRALPREGSKVDDFDSEETKPIDARNLLLLTLGDRVDDLSESQRQHLLTSISEATNIRLDCIHVSPSQSSGHVLALYFVNPSATDPDSLDDLMLASAVVGFVRRAHLGAAPVGVQDVFSQESLMMDAQTFLSEPFFPYVAAGCAVVFVLLLALFIWCCMRRYRKKKENSLLHGAKVLPPSTAPQQVSILYPLTKPGVGNATIIQPDVAQILTNRSVLGSLPSSRQMGTPMSGSGSGTPVYSSSSQSGTPIMGGTPVHTPPLRLRRGLLESRRGSSASLTIDLGSTTSETPSVGSPPRESSAEEYLQAASNRLSRQKLRNCVKSIKSLHEEFWEVPMNHPDKIEVAGSGMKNRYRTIIPNEHSRVKLPEINQDPVSSYINANYIRGYRGEPNAFIATQGPMSNTVEDFWRMVWHEKAPIIVMITKLREKNRSKCESYIPENYSVFGDFEVIVRSISDKDGFILRQLSLKYLNEEHRIWHYWYTAWPDHKAPNTARQLLELVRAVDQQRASDTSQQAPACTGPTIVHCSAGIGRTGCFIATSVGMQQLQRENSVDILYLLSQMRLDRGGMVQTNEQYEFIHHALALYEHELPERPAFLLP